MNGQQWVTDIHGNNLHPMSEQNVKDVSASVPWAIHVPGPEEYHAAPSREAAQQMAVRHNAAMSEYLARRQTELSVSTASITATAVPWPFDAESHAEEIADFDYADWGIGQKPEGGAA